MSVGKRPRSISRRSSSAVPRAAISRATTSRGASSSVKRSPSLVEQDRAFAAKRLGEEKRGVDERRGMELHELEIAERGSGAVGGRHPVADRAGRVGRPLPERRRPARGEQRGPRRDRAGGR